jgi:hypothetical protein
MGGQPLPVARKRGAQLGGAGRGGGAVADHHDIERGKLRMVQTETFADLALDAVAHDGTRRGLAGHGDPETRMGKRIAGAVDGEHRVARLAATTQHMGEERWFA